MRRSVLLPVASEGIDSLEGSASTASENEKKSSRWSRDQAASAGSDAARSWRARSIRRGPALVSARFMDAESSIITAMRLGSRATCRSSMAGSRKRNSAVIAALARRPRMIARRQAVTPWVERHASARMATTAAAPRPSPTRPQGDSSTQRCSLKSALPRAARRTVTAISASATMAPPDKSAVVPNAAPKPGRPRRTANTAATASTSAARTSATRSHGSSSSMSAWLLAAWRRNASCASRLPHLRGFAGTFAPSSGRQRLRFMMNGTCTWSVL
ncbi:MAG: hypothetical protein IPI49_21945 [Myxococcales bacterium]|nr:hypothetical protein [Myxococcales bacterium]